MKISILCACYNCDKYIAHCIDSVINQTYNNWEMLILDDQSNDRSFNIIKSYSEKDNRIKIIKHNRRLHCGGAYNILSGYATGEISAVLDADDCLVKSAMQHLVNAYKTTNADFIWTQFKICDAKMNPIGKGFCKLPDEGKSLLDSRHAFSHWRTFKTELNQRGLIFNPKFKSAVDKWMGYTLEEIGQGYFFDKILYLYRRRTGGLSYTGRKNWAKIRKHFLNKRKKDGCTPIPIKLIKHETSD